MAGDGAIGWRSRRLDAGRIFPPPMTDSARLAAALADRYRLDRELGQGGIATVYLAEDLKHQRKVAKRMALPEDLRR